MTQESFSRHFGSPMYPAGEFNRPFSTDEQAKIARDARYRELKSKGYDVRRSVLKGQLRKYWTLGNPCGIVAPCYYLDYDGGPNE